MAEYRVCETPVEDLGEDEVLAEANELRKRIARVRQSIAERKRWAISKGEQTGREYNDWMARIATLRGKLESRYAEIRPREKHINQSRRRKHG